MSKKVFIPLLMSVFIVSCATRKVNLVASPPAKVFVGSGFSSEYKELGQTPIEVSLKDHVAGDKFAYLEFKADGYKEHRVVLPGNYISGVVEVQLNKNEEVSEIEERIKTNFQSKINSLEDRISDQRRLFREERKDIESSFKNRSNRIFRKVMEVQNALNIRKMAKAAKALAELKVLDAPENLILTLEGNFEFVNGKPKRALASYNRALNLDPGNVELSGIIKELQEALK